MKEILILLYILNTCIIAGMIGGWIVVKMFTFSVPIIPKKENNKSFYILAAIHIVLGILILKL